MSTQDDKNKAEPTSTAEPITSAARPARASLDDEDPTIYKVVVNHEEQYSIWPAYKKLPPGWNEVGKSGPKAECLAYINEVWTDMRPLSLRKAMDGDITARAS